MRSATKRRIAQEVLNWRHDGVISAELAELLAVRYDTGASMMSTSLRWLGIFAVVLLGMSVLGLVGMALGEAALYISPFLLGAVAVSAIYFGAQMASSAEQRYPLSGTVLLTAGLIGIYGALTLLFFAFGGTRYLAVFPWFMVLTAAVSAATAYRYGQRWPLFLGILLLFHGLGNWHAYAGHGAYVLGIRDERITALAGAIAIGIGLWHEHAMEADDDARWIGFGHLFIVFGLLYASVSAWFLSLSPGGVVWVVVFTLLGLGELIAGARMRDARFTGFGVVLLSIDFYTRFFEYFWDVLSKGLFFLLAGAAAVAAGAAMEFRSRQSHAGRAR